MHETRSLTQQVGAVEFIEPPASATRLHVDASALADAGEDEAARVVQRPGTHRPVPAPAVPRDADGDMVERQAAGTGDHLLNSRLRTVVGPIGCDSEPQQGRGTLPG